MDNTANVVNLMVVCVFDQKMQIFQDSLERLLQKFSDVPDMAVKSQTEGVKMEDLQHELNQTKVFKQFMLHQINNLQL